jgi:FtsP/CotA-like multicopper oxidase with cupredoxin domain
MPKDPLRPQLAARTLMATILAAGIALPARSETVTLEAVRDNTLYQTSTGSLSNGAGEHVFAGRSNQADSLSRRRALLAFDVASQLPPGSTVVSATLTLRLSRTRTSTLRSVTAHRLLADWGEGASDAEGQEGDGAPAEPGDATWLHTFYDTDFWATPGGDFVSTPSAQTQVGGTGFYDWTSAQLAADVQGWLDDPGSDFGWVLIGEESASATAKRFESRENSNVVRRPRLTIEFLPPADTGACCLGAGQCKILDASGCLGAGGVFQGVGSACTPNPCPQPTGACCFGDGSCMELEAPICNKLGGSYQGHGTDCAGASCPVVTGACCLPGTPGSCGALDPVACTAAGGGFLGEDTQCGIELCPFVDPLPRPAVAQPVTGAPGGAAHYEIAMTELEQQLHRDLPPTTVWAYGGSYPGPTVEAWRGEPVTVDWINDLRGPDGELREEHLLPVDTCLHGPDMWGPVARTVVHLHGGHVPADSDGHPDDAFLPGESLLYTYPNNQLPGTLWYHDHALGLTRLNVYLGLAGFYLLRDEVEAALGLPSGVYEVAMAIQDRSFHPDGSFAYPELWQEDFFGDRMLVNGKVWPYLDVARGKYRFRLLNGSNSRTLTLALSDGSSIHLIGVEGGLLPAPVALAEVTLGPGERADVVVDFADHPAGTRLELVNGAPAGHQGRSADLPRVLELRVLDEVGHTAPLPPDLRPLEVLQEEDAVVTRTLELFKVPDDCTGSRWTIDGLGWHDITEEPRLGDTEIWSFVNRSGMMHPMHLHLVMFQVLDRQPFELVDGEVVPTGPPYPPGPEERGWKDTVRALPWEITRVIARFEGYAGVFPYHCHILEHEDHEMMRQFRTIDPVVFRDGFESGDTSAWGP